MTWTASETPHEDASAAPGHPNPTTGPGGPISAGGSGGPAAPAAHDWVPEPLAPGALGATPTPTAQDDDGAAASDLPDLPPLTGPLDEALTTARAAADAAVHAAGYLASLSAHQRVQALQQAAKVRDVTDATLLLLTASFTPDDLITVGAKNPTDLLTTHTGVDPRRATSEVHLAKALTFPIAPLPFPPTGCDQDTGTTGPTDDDADSDQGAEGAGVGFGIDLDAERAATAATSPVRLHTGEGLGRLGAAHAAGRVSTDIASLARRVVGSLPRRIQRARGPEADALLAATLPGLTYPEAVTACETLAHTLDPDRADRGFNPDDIDRRYLNFTVHADGTVDLRARLDAVTGAEVKAAIDHLSAPDPTTTAPLADDTGDDVPLPGVDTPDSDTRPRGGVAVRDERTPAQRRADALALLTRLGRTGDQTRGGEPPRIIATATADQLTGLPGAGAATCETTNRPLSTTALRHLACTAVLHTVTLSCQGPAAAALALGRSVRLFSPAQRRAMLARDGGCIIPGCTSPPGWWEAHHVHDWAEGGPTDVEHG
ncbi:HNH endonuclease signature motif containing protein, partial [Quadrisphaera granulorum]|uniref:HNH endonuclease signature motif containing protein n=1 Tax=Quadrisphaera granulorum TaxID=317664 RepID=UPI0011B85C19